MVKVNAIVAGYSTTYRNILSIRDDSTATTVTLFIDFEVWDSLSAVQRSLLNTIGYRFIVIGTEKFIDRIRSLLVTISKLIN